jgi:hypothetical protein
MKPFDRHDKLECLSLLSLVEYLRTYLQSGALEVAPLGRAKNPDLSRTFEILANHFFICFERSSLLSYIMLVIPRS